MTITEYFEHIISQHRSIDIAESEFKIMLCDNPPLKAAYKKWCADNGLTEKSGFIEYCNSYLDNEEDKWNVLESDN